VFLQALSKSYSILQLNKLILSDEGVYTCRASNDDGVTDEKIKLELIKSEYTSVLHNFTYGLPMNWLFLEYNIRRNFRERFSRVLTFFAKDYLA